MPNDNEILIDQFNSLQSTFASLTCNYLKLLDKRLKGTLTRDEYMMYDLMDMLILLSAAYEEIVSNHVDPSYMLEKLGRIEDYIQPVIAHFKDKNGGDNKCGTD